MCHVLPNERARTAIGYAEFVAEKPALLTHGLLHQARRPILKQIVWKISGLYRCS